MAAGRASRARALAASLVIVLTGVRSAEACPDCAVGRQARSEVWTDDFAFNLFVAVLPFLLIVSICLYVETIERARSRFP